ncbi:MAG TPA: SdpI family protein [Thermoanaerobaculia bacterium]|nr:SdpI family protein [Thermoanaerobaculia bacterium]
MRWMPAVIVVAAFAITVLAYPALPEVVPIHWNLAGEVDRTAPKFPGAFIMPIVLLLAAITFEAVPRISPRGFEVDGQARGFRAIKLVSLASLLLLHAVTLAASAGLPVRIGVFVPVSIGALFVVIGNYLGTLQRNFFVGIRTPWTLASDDVWFRTHRLGARMFMIGGVALMFTGFMQPRAILVSLLTVLAVIVVVPVVYSYRVSRT